MNRTYPNILVAIAMSLLPTVAFSQSVFNEMDYTPVKTVFHLNAPTPQKVDGVTGATPKVATPRPAVKIRIYDAGLGGKPVKTVSMKPVDLNRWEASVKGNLKGKFYTFDIGDGETPGVFAKAVGVNGKRGAIINMEETNPIGWKADVRPPLKSPADLVIYEMHWRDFSIDASSGLMYKGKFLSLAEPKAIAYLKSLGVNAVHILPSFDHSSIDETRLDVPQYNWGYDPLNYNVPEGSYSTDPYNPATRIEEFKQMVLSLHKAGIRVILDVVYNHTSSIEGSNFQLTYPDYYYRKTADGQYSNGSGCGNETASEHPLMREFMLESVKYWVDEYHIDGFRFDLMGIHDLETMNLIRQELSSIDPSIFVYGEGWSAGTCAYPADQLATKANVNKLPGIAAFSDELRDALRGPFSDDHKGAFLAGLAGEEESIKFGIAGAVQHPQIDLSKVNYAKNFWATEPTQMISYVSCHDDLCLVDRLKTELPGIAQDELIRLDLLAQTAVFTSQGVPFMLSGEEMLRDKKGIHNSFNSPDSINRLDWNNLQRYPQVFAYYQNLIKLRQEHPAFRLGKADLVRSHLEFLPTQPCVVGYRLKHLEGIDPWTDIVVVLNANKAVRSVVLPTGLTYAVVLKDGVFASSENTETVSGNVEVPAQSALILRMVSAEN